MAKLFEEGFTQNRELSWLNFNSRIVEEAKDETVPLYERIKFIEIFASNLDEFFMVRVGSLMDIARIDKYDIDSKSGMNADEQLEAIMDCLQDMYDDRDDAYDIIINKLAEKNVEILRYNQLEDDEAAFVEKRFMETIAPHIECNIMSYPELADLDDCVTYYVATLDDGSDKIAVLSLSEEAPQYIIIALGDRGISVIPTEELVKAYLPALIEPFTALSQFAIRITRCADSVDEENAKLPGDFRDKMQALINLREKMPICRLELDSYLDSGLLAQIIAAMGIPASQCFVTSTPMSMDFIYAIEDNIPEGIRREICYEKFTPVDQFTPADGRIMDIVKEQDILSAYPYESMNPLISLLSEAADSSDVKEINMTIYRVKDNSVLMESLCRAAQNGIKVRVLVELRARFDEQHNIDLTDKLEAAGVKVFYGSDTFKAHSKVLQIVLRDKKYITQVSTGNYNEKTAKRYTDLSLITYNQEISRDIHKFFKNVFKGDTDDDYKEVLVSPAILKKGLIKLIERETKKKSQGRIFLKCNAVTDSDIIDKLQDASCAGVQIRMVVRGISCLLPGVEFCTENIEIVNVVGRFLEHSRVYVFGSGRDEVMYISSADLMTRNTERRFEIACPVYDTEAKAKIKHIIKLAFQDNLKGRRLNSAGKYEKKRIYGREIDSQRILMNEALSGVLGR